MGLPSSASRPAHSSAGVRPVFPCGAGRQPSSSRARGAALGDQAPDFYAQTAAERGLPGLILWLGAVGSVCAVGARALRGLSAESVRRPVLTGGLTAVGAWAVDALANPAWEYGQAQFFLWLTLGLILAGTDGRTAGVGEADPAMPMCYNQPTRFLLLLLLGGGLLALIAHTLPILPRAQG